MEATGRAGAQAGALSSGWAGIELARGAVHEWIGHEWTEPGGNPPLALLAHLAWRALEGGPEGGGQVLWIGRRVFPYPRALVRDCELRFDAGESALELVRLGSGERPADPARLFERSLHVDVSEGPARLWALDVALRCPAVTAVVGDASGFDMAATRRLQLAAEAVGGIAFLARPARERRALSAAATRWHLRRRPASAGRPCWSLELLRRKSVLCPASSH